jgi:bla regulator protein BlaR1
MTTVIDVVNHVWQSTLFAAIAGLLTLVLRKNRAQTRCWLWFAASVKFFLPFSLLMIAGSHFGRRAPAPNVSSNIAQTIEQVGEPFAAAIPIASAPAAQSWRRIRAAVRTASPMHLSIDIPAVSSPAFPEPGVIGVFRPVLLLPEGIVECLTPPQTRCSPRWNNSSG